MLICRPHRVLIIPVAGLAISLGLLGFGVVSYIVGDAGWSLVLGVGVVLLGVLVHVLMSFMQLRRDGELLSWRGVLASGNVPAERCELVATLTPAPGREPTFEVSLVCGDQPLVDVGSLPHGPRGEAQLAAMVEALELGPARVVRSAE